MSIQTQPHEGGEEADLKTRREASVTEAVRSVIAALQPLTAALLGCITPAEVVEVVVERGVAVLGARAGLVALLSDDGTHLEIVRTAGYSPEVMKGWERFPLAADLPLSDAVRNNEALLFEGRTDWTARYPDMVRQIPQGNYLASASLPLSARGKVFGALHFSFPTERSFSAVDQEFLADISRQCALALDRAILLERAELSRVQAEYARAQAEAARDEAQAANRRLEFLSRASALLGESLDYQSRLEELARLCVPEIADWAGVDILGEGGDLVRLAVAHRDPAREEAMREIQRRYPPQAQRGASTLTVIQTGERIFYPDIPEHLIDQGAVDADHARLLKAVGVKAALSLPLIARGRTLGALSLGTGPEPAGSGRSFLPETVALAEELARRAAILIDNARLFGSVEASLDALRASEERYRTLFETASLGIVYQDGDAAIIDANPAAQRILGLTLDQMQGRTSLDPRWRAVREDGSVFPGDEHPVPRALASCGIERAVMGVFHPQDEAYRWIDVTAVPKCDAGEDRPHLVYALFEDITERRRAEEERRAGEQELARREAEYAALVENAPDILTRFGPDLRLRYVSRAAERYMGVPRASLIGKTVGEMAGVPDDNARHWEEALRAAFATGEPQSLRFEYRAPDDGGEGAAAFRHFDASLTPEVDAQGRVVSVITVTHDTTARAEGERALREAARKQRRFLKEMLSGFTEGRLRLCFSEGELPDPLSPMSEPIPLSDAALRLLRKRVQSVGGTLDVSAERLQGFATAVHEAAVNALKYGGGGTARIHADTTTGTIQVWVADDGPGIAEEMIHRAIEKGYTTQGFGYGMFYMQSCADRLYLLSETGRGTTLVLEIDRNAPEPAWLTR